VEEEMMEKSPRISGVLLGVWLLSGAALAQTTLLYAPALTRPTSEAPGGVAARPGGGFAITIPGKRQVLLYKTDGTLEKALSIVGRPYSISVLNSGRLVIGDRKNGEVAIFDTKGAKTTLLGKGGGEFGDPVDIDVDRGQQRIYVLDAKKHQVRVFKWDGQPLMTIGSKGLLGGQFMSPASLAVHASTGDILVSDSVNHRVEVFNKFGVFLYSIGVYGIGGYGSGEGKLHRPSGIAIDGQGRVLIADSWQGWVQAFNRAGTYLGRCVDYGQENGHLLAPGDLAVDATNRLIATSTLKIVTATATYPTRIEVFTNLTPGTNPSPTTAEPSDRTAQVTGPGYFAKDEATLQEFRIEFWGARFGMVLQDKVLLHGKYRAVKFEETAGLLPCTFKVWFRQSDLIELMASTTKDVVTMKITGALTGGTTFSGTTDLKRKKEKEKLPTRND
jgi:DNA-binding beta-propeller fold protein YncE